MRLLALLYALFHAAVFPPAHDAPVVQRPVWPADGVITSPYGRDGARWHPGVDIGSLRDLRVRAALPGRVVETGYARGYEGYGNVVVVRRGKLTELYGHLASVRVHRGARVRIGERLGTAGCTGYCTGTHLHYEMRRGARTLNPLRYVHVPAARVLARAAG